MAIPCQACAQPVEDQVVTCPHCGGATGVQPDPRAVLQLELIKGAKLPAPVSSAPAIDVPIDQPDIGDGGLFDLVHAVVAVVDAAVTAVRSESEARASAPELPRAIARERPPQPVTRDCRRRPRSSRPPRTRLATSSERRRWCYPRWRRFIMVVASASSRADARCRGIAHLASSACILTGDPRHREPPPRPEPSHGAPP